MGEELNTIIINNGNELRLERIALPNGKTYIIGISVEEAETIFNTLNENISAVNDDVLKLQTENQTLNDEIAALKEEIALIKKEYISYVNIDEAATNTTITE